MSGNEISAPVKERNPITHESHRRQAFWQIYFPMILFGTLVVVALVLVLIAEDQGVSKWADISLIYIISLVMVAFLVTSAILVLSVIYTRRLYKAAPFFFFNVQKFTFLAELRVKDVSTSAAEPFIRIRSFFAGLRALRRR